MVCIRLSRVGKKSQVTYRFVVSDKRKDLYGPALEILGTFDPHANPTAIAVKSDRIHYWLGKGAKTSATVHNLLVTAGVLKLPKVVKAKAPKKDEPKVEAAAPAAAPAAEAPKIEEKPVEAPKVEEKPAEAPKVEEKKAEAPAA